jgi:hypothetical protein
MLLLLHTHALRTLAGVESRHIPQLSDIARDSSPIRHRFIAAR